jgi:hypothetical protein
MAAASGLAVPPEFVQALRELGLAKSGSLTGAPLTGGVSSDIWRIDTEQGPVCAKRALAQLRVAPDWHAPIERNLYEARWMQVANEAQPGCTPRVLGQHPALGVLVMNLPPSEYRLGDPVDPRLGLCRFPNQDERVDDFSNRETLWNDDESRTRRRPDEVPEVSDSGSSRATGNLRCLGT